MTHLPKESKIILYADDIALYCSHEQTSIISKKLQRDLNKIAIFLKNLNLIISDSKTRTMLIAPTPNTKCVMDKLTLNYKELEETDCFKYLGNLIDNNLTWKNQVNDMCKNSYFALSKLKPSANHMPLDLKLKLYKSLVQPRVEYCSSVWHRALSSMQAKQIETVQNRCMSYISGKKLSSVNTGTKFREELKLEKLHSRRELNFATMVYKYFTNRLPKGLEELMPESSQEITHNYNTRHKESHANRIPIPLKYRKNFEKTFHYNAAKLWDIISSEMKRAASVHVFKSKFKLLWNPMEPETI